MPKYFPSRPALYLTLISAAALGALALASPATAQDYGRDAGPDYQGGPTEEVVVTAPRYRPREERSAIGAPIVNVSLSGEVSYDDLDLRTSWGVRELRARIRYVARDLCRRMDLRFPIAADGSPPCYRLAYDRAMDQADAAIDRARDYAYRY
jgi:UrcA family protein